MCEIRIRPDGSFWVVVTDGDHDQRERFPTMELAVGSTLKRAATERPVKVMLDRAKDDQLVLCRYE